MYSSSHFFRSIAVCLLFVLVFNTFGSTYVLASEDGTGSGATEISPSVENGIETPSVIESTQSGSESVIEETLTGEIV